MTSKHAQKHHIKKSEKNSFIEKFLNSKNCENGKKLLFFWALEGRISNLFSQFFENYF